jgi:hypothetical protein
MYGQPPPGQWPTAISESELEHLLRVARRRLVGYEHLAPDAVSRAIIRWSQFKLQPDTLARARIEVVVRSEADNLRRSEQRRQRREALVCHDRSLSLGSRIQAHDSHLLRWTIADYCRREQVNLTITDVEVLELLFAGLALSETARELDLTRYQVLTIRRKWRILLSSLLDRR